MTKHKGKRSKLTDKQRARRYALRRYPFHDDPCPIKPDNADYIFVRSLVRRAYEVAYLAGLRAGRRLEKNAK